MVAQAAATAEAALKTDLHGDLKKALANVKPKVSHYPILLKCIIWLSLGASDLAACAPLWSQQTADIPEGPNLKVSNCTLQLLIDGEFVDSSSGKTFETEDPRTGEVLVEVAEAQEEDVDRAVKAARKVRVSRTFWQLCHELPITLRWCQSLLLESWPMRTTHHCKVCNVWRLWHLKCSFLAGAGI